MKTFVMSGDPLGGNPSAVVTASNWAQAKETYNDWLESTYGERDDGVGVTELLSGQIVRIIGGFAVCDVFADRQLDVEDHS